MEQVSQENRTKEVKKNNSISAVRIKPKAQKKLSSLLTKANKKDFGKRIKATDLIELALEMIEDSHIKKLQQGSLSNSDLLEMNFREYIKKNGKISKDEYLGILMQQNQSA